MSKRRHTIRQELQTFHKVTGDIRFANAIEALDRWGIKKKTAGAPPKWRGAELIRLWASVQALTAEKKTISDACRILVKGEGFGYGEYDEAGTEKKVIIKNYRTLNRLYNEAVKLVRGNPQALNRANISKRIFISARHPDNKIAAEQVRLDRIESDKKFSKSLRKLAEKNSRKK